jgi:hypothetical protein
MPASAACSTGSSASPGHRLHRRPALLIALGPVPNGATDRMMSARLRRSLLAVPALLALFTFVAPLATSAASGFMVATYFRGAYERQVDSRTCVAASVAMMMNILSHRDLNLNQLAILRYAQPRDALNDATQRGSDPLGWATAASYYSGVTPRPTAYRWEAYSTKRAALERAATQIARFHKPVGLLVRHGAHAVVMSGFTSNRDPLKGAFTITGIWFSDPLGGSNAYVSAASAPLNSYLQLDATPSYDRAWYGKYVIVVPRT